MGKTAKKILTLSSISFFIISPLTLIIKVEFLNQDLSASTLRLIYSIVSLVFNNKSSCNSNLNYRNWAWKKWLIDLKLKEYLEEDFPYVKKKD